ncbi:hypothetical protein [Burkholderia sp. MSMB1835]|uniref:hypothetical protein n=1 Tax=Burkholderia sp. MSMB1835 TaxID=1637876 RepID=UPI0012E372EA|nr:hypothetical protein [Burkholderia sp. MSMB1835]
MRWQASAGAGHSAAGVTPPDSIRFDGAPQYHAWKLGVWEFPLHVDEIRYTAMIDCNEQLASYGRTVDPLGVPTKQAHDRPPLRK